MLEVRNIKKEYNTGGFKQKALDDVSVSFRQSEFVSILGPSGSGKTTFLNIVGGLDHYDSGDLIINGISTKKYKDSDWDSYRNHRIGFVFQSYNLIPHQSVLNNVKLALTLSGISKAEAIKRSKDVLKQVGLIKHIYKKPSELSGGQMQRVAIARALVNNPDVLLLDEPTGALDSETSIQIMDILRKVAKDKLVVMVTHNPDLANTYSSRIITLKDGKITSDSNPVEEDKEKEVIHAREKKTSMSFFTALSLSFSNLLTKKGRTVLVAFAGSIGIIGISLILAVSTGFQNYVDSLEKETLTSYPLTIMEETTDVTGALLSLAEGKQDKKGTNIVVESQTIGSMLSNVSTNDLKSFDKYLHKNYKEVEKDISTISYSYSIDPIIYTHDATGALAKLNPNNLFTSIYGSNSMFSSYSSLASIYTQMIDNVDLVKDDYQVLAGRYPKEYNEMLLVLSDSNDISDLLVYSLGLRDTKELNKMISAIMSGEQVTIDNRPLEITYEELMDLELKVILPSKIYKYNSKYDVYEDMSEDSDYMEDIYDEAVDLKIVGIVCPKEGTTTMALSPGISYTSGLVKYIIDHSKDSEIVKKQLEKSNIDIFSGTKFGEKNDYNLSFEDLVKVDEKKLNSMFSTNVSEEEIKKIITSSTEEILGDISVDTTPAKNKFMEVLNYLEDGVMNKMLEIDEDVEITTADIDPIVKEYLSSSEASNKMNEIAKEYLLPMDTLNQTFYGLLNGYLMSNLSYGLNKDAYNNTVPIVSVSEAMAKGMTEAKMKISVAGKVGKLSTNLVTKMANAFDINPDDFASAFSLNFSEDELMRVVSSMLNNNESTLKSNLIKLGYQNIEEPTYISFYFTSFEGKEHFKEFLDDYNEKVDEEKVINYSDVAGILMDSVRAIVDAVSYVLIAFVSISLVVSSIMIGIITYISVFERTKEIGILRSIGASKGNISEIFNAETFIIGLLSGIFGITISYILIPIINMILHKYIGDIPLYATLNINHALRLIVLSVILTLISGLIPARGASKKDPVVALRME